MAKPVSAELFVGRGQSPTTKEYQRTFRLPGTIHAACEDYRAGASIDMQHDREDRGKKVECPLLVLWARAAPLARLFDIPATWKSWARNVVAQSKGLPGGHQMPDSAPKDVATALRAFLKS